MKYNIFIVGPAGSGKTTLGKYISKKINFKFIDCDNFHLKKNKLKMKKGKALNQLERLAWLKEIKKKLKIYNNKNLIIAFSGLYRQHREYLLLKNKINFFYYLKCSKKTLKERIKSRKNHFFNPILLNDQIKKFQNKNDLIIVKSSNSMYSNFKFIVNKSNGIKL